VVIHGDRLNTTGTYCLIATIRIFTAQRVVMNVGSSGMSVRNVIPDLGNDCVGF